MKNYKQLVESKIGTRAYEKDLDAINEGWDPSADFESSYVYEEVVEENDLDTEDDEVVYGLMEAIIKLYE